jgi:hypothetical protein
MAGSNWLLWKADYEFSGPPEEMPVLVKTDRYRAFVKSYSVLRYLPNDERETLRRRLCGARDFGEMTRRADGGGVDELAQRLNGEYPAFEIQRSFLSKLAAFARPDSFVAWDRFARRGVAALTNGPTSGNYHSYSLYLKAVNSTWEGELGHQVRQFLTDRQIPAMEQDGGAFSRRVLDCYLMICGGRWSTELSR